MRYLVRMNGRISGEGGETLPPEEIEAIFDAIMEHLMTLGAADPDIGGRLTTGECHMAVLVEAEDQYQAVEIASGLMRTAIHYCGGATPDWAVTNLSFAVDSDAEESEAGAPTLVEA